ncbi:hypothetical protein E1B28_011389 [Marasmius oreades]|uniref:Zn(2)-C6 fungal-type domain-containing protein n=1 Tax=Marasmius oreades TaxID=181124 RepID=A0A9P7UQ59_9AGAR|nr:uncharacterized protein E1B28_011389 [Marasmius oreades]KAG7089735.1 hypothetical protein E1B28_011389 [Marasmius oreades]
MMEDWNHDIEQEYSRSYVQPVFNGPYSSQYQGFNPNNDYSRHPPSYPPTLQQNRPAFPVEGHQQQQPAHLSPSSTFPNGNSFNALSIPGSATSYQNSTFNFQPSPAQSSPFDQTTSPNEGLFSLPPVENRGQSTHAAQPYYSTLGQPVGQKRGRGHDSQNDDRFDEELDPGRGEHKDNQKAKPGACARCKNLKVRCEFKTETDPCKRCFNGGHECMIPGRKKRRTPPKREHLLAEIQKQHETIEKLMVQLAKAEEFKKNQSRSSVSDTLSGTPSPPVLSPSSGSYFEEQSPDTMNPEKNKVVEDWIIKARESLAQFGGFIGIGGGMPKKYIVKEDPEDSPSSGDEEETESGAEDYNSGDGYEIAVEDSDGEGSPKSQTNVTRRTSSRSRRGSHSSAGDGGLPHHRKHNAGFELATLPSEAAPFGLMAKMSLKNRKRGSSAEFEESGAHNVNSENGGVANVDFFRASPAPDPKRPEVDDRPQAPAILVKGLITPTEAEELFKLFFDTMNLSVSLVDPVLYTAQRTVHRSPFLFTVICALASRFYTKRPGLYQQAMAYAQIAAGSSLIGGQKNVEMCMAYILMSLYPAPFKRWEDSRSYLYLGLAIRIAIELNLHLPPTATPQNEVHAREQLNRTRVWINCFNLDRSTSSQYGKRPIISSIDFIANHSENWWGSSEYNLKDFDIQLCCYNAELKVIGKFIEKIYSDPDHPTGLNKNLNFEEVAINTDEELQQLEQKWWPILDANVDQEDPQGGFRVGLLKMAYSYSRLLALSYGFQHAFGKNTSNNQNEKSFLMRCILAATDLIKSVVEFNNREERWIYVRHGPDAQSVFITFAAAFLVKILQPKFAHHLDDSVRTDIRQHVQSVIDYLGSPQIGADERYSPKMYAKFLKNLLAVSLFSSGSEILRRRSTKSSASATSTDASNPFHQSAGTASNHPSPSPTHPLSPPSHETLSFDQFVPSNADSFTPAPSFSTGTTSLNGYNVNRTNIGLELTDYFPAPMMGTGFTEDEMMQSMSMNMQQPLNAPNQQWPPGITWLSQFNFQNDAQMMYG